MIIGKHIASVLQLDKGLLTNAGVALLFLSITLVFPGGQRGDMLVLV